MVTLYTQTHKAQATTYLKQALEFIVKSQEYNTEMFIGKTIDNLPKKYTIDEHEEGVVIREEVC